MRLQLLVKYYELVMPQNSLDSDGTTTTPTPMTIDLNCSSRSKEEKALFLRTSVLQYQKNAFTFFPLPTGNQQLSSERIKIQYELKETCPRLVCILRPCSVSALSLFFPTRGHFHGFLEESTVTTIIHKSPPRTTAPDRQLTYLQSLHDGWPLYVTNWTTSMACLRSGEVEKSRNLSTPKSSPEGTPRSDAFRYLRT